MKRYKPAGRRASLSPVPARQIFLRAPSRVFFRWTGGLTDSSQTHAVVISGCRWYADYYLRFIMIAYVQFELK